MRRSRHLRPTASPFDLAITAMRRLFPQSSFMLEYDARHGIVHATAALTSASIRIATGQPSLRTKPVARPRHHAMVAKAVVQPVVIPRCREKACPWPVHTNGFCRQHAVDAMAERSLVPSPTWTGLSGLRHFA